jgi:hypothetical protein
VEIIFGNHFGKNISRDAKMFMNSFWESDFRK